MTASRLRLVALALAALPTSILVQCLTAVAVGQKGVEVLTVRGTVSDEAGQPVSGATVRLVMEPNSQQQLIFDRLLGHEPLPWTRSVEDGQFTLALLPGHQYLGGLEFGRMGLVVEKPGYQPWREHVPRPLQLYAGSRVRLHKLRPSDHARVVVEDAAAGTRVRVRRFDNYDLGAGYGELRAEEQTYEVPADGVLSVPVPLLPSPAILPLTTDYIVLRRDVELSWSGGNTAPQAITAGDEVRLGRGSAPGTRPTAEAPRRAKTGEVRHGTVRFRVTDDTDRPIEDALPTLLIRRPGEEQLRYWIPPDATDWFTDREGFVEWDRVPAGQVFPSAIKPSWMPLGPGSEARQLPPGEAIEVELQLRGEVDYEVHVRDATGEPVPFAELKNEDWTYNPDGSSMGSMFHLRADSFGVARARRPADSPLDLQQVDPRVRERRGKSVPAGHSEFIVRRHPRVLLRTTPGQLLTGYAVPRAIYSPGRMTPLGGGILWRGMATVGFGVRGAPPVVWVAPADPAEHEGKSLLDVDRSRVVRRVPLAISGAGDIDLTGLRAVPVAVEGQKYLRGLESNMAERGVSGEWSLASRDEYAHDCLLMHPEFLLRRVAIPRADAPGAAGPVSVELVKGAPVVIRFSLVRELHDLDRLTLWVAHTNITARVLSGGPVYSGALPLTPEQRKQRQFSLPLPFALGPASYQIHVQGTQGTAENTVEIEGHSPTVVELGQLLY